ncbi:MAG: ABC transporter permease [Acidimicrobiia bacterium]|nr:ABC transporter permease [Acidimicrobiia bacterium]
MIARPFIDWGWIVDHLDEIRDRIGEHLALTAIALGIGLIIALVLALAGLRVPRALPPITWTAGVLYTIPSLALFAFLVPITGFTTLTAEIGLVSYTLLILIRSIVTGIQGIDPAVTEAARGMGYSPRRMLWEIELPLALPVIVAGVRLAAVTTVGLVTVTALIGLGGVGFFILRGLNRFFDTEIVLGTALSVMLAMILDAALVGIERVLTPWSRRRSAT